MGWLIVEGAPSGYTAEADLLPLFLKLLTELSKRSGVIHERYERFS